MCGLLLLPTVILMTIQKKPAIHHLLCHLLRRPPNQCQMQSQFDIVGFINKGNTCCANSILQILSVMPTPWNRIPLESNTLSLLLGPTSLNTVVKKNLTKPVDPPNFLWALKCKLSNFRGVPFGFNTQQDVAKILQFV